MSAIERGEAAGAAAPVTADAVDRRRRQWLQLAAATPLLIGTRAVHAGADHVRVDAAGTDATRAVDGEFIHDVARVDRMRVARVARPADTQQVQRHVREWRGPVSIGGGRYSMGGQIAADRSLHLDMRDMNGVLHVDAQARTVRVQAGARWRDLQQQLDRHDLSVAVMQSYANFTVGGSISVNCHGRYVSAGPIAGSIRALQLVTADGDAIELSRARHPELFGAVIGGYGGLGVVTEVELDLAPNTRIERRVERIALDQYPAYFRDRVLGDASALLHNADLAPPAFDRPFALTWHRTDRDVTEAARLHARDARHDGDRAALWLASELPFGPALRARHQQAMLGADAPVVWRNFEASLDVASLEPASRVHDTYLLQEYFVPVAAFLPFARRMAQVLREHRVNALNVSIRHSPADATALLRWAPVEVFCFVLFHKQRNDASAERDAAVWTRLLVEAALECGGCHYLPYRMHATAEQVARGYPGLAEFARIKSEVDPTDRFHNRLWQRYLPGATA